MSEEKRNEFGTFGDNYYKAGDAQNFNKYCEMWKAAGFESSQALASAWTRGFKDQFCTVGWLPGCDQELLDALKNAKWQEEHITTLIETAADEKDFKACIKGIAKELGIKIKAIQVGRLYQPFHVYHAQEGEMKPGGGGLDGPHPDEPSKYGFANQHK